MSNLQFLQKRVVEAILVSTTPASREHWHASVLAEDNVYDIQAILLSTERATVLAEDNIWRGPALLPVLCLLRCRPTEAAILRCRFCISIQLYQDHEATIQHVLP